MSKLSNMLLMLFELQKGGIHSIEALSNILEVTPRQIRRYRDDLEKSGIFVQSKTGKHGGYFLDEEHKTIQIDTNSNTHYHLFNRLFKDEKSLTLREIADIHHLYLKDDSIINTVISLKDLSVMKPYIILYYAINKKLEIEINYLTSYTAIMIKRTIQPYFLYEKFNTVYLAALDTQDRRMKYYRLSKIEGIKLNNISYEMDTKLLKKEKEIVEKNHGVFYKSELFQVRVVTNISLKTNLTDLFGESIACEEVDTQLYATIMAGSEKEMFYRLLVFGSKVQVLEPKTLAFKLKEEFKKAYQSYE